jgi:phage-related protein
VALVRDLPKIIKAVVAAIPDIIDALYNAVLDNIGLFIQAGVDLLVSLVKNLPEIILTVSAAMPEIVNALVKALGDVGWKIVDAGGKLIEGLWSGIKDAGAWLWDKISGFCDNIVVQVKNFFGIKSPSKVFAGIGKNMGMGVGVGWVDSMKTVAKMMVNSVPTDLPDVSISGVTVSRPSYTPYDYEAAKIQKADYSGAKNSSDPINYDRLGSALANALVGMGISVDGRQFGRVMRNLA